MDWMLLYWLVLLLVLLLWNLANFVSGVEMVRDRKVGAGIMLAISLCGVLASANGVMRHLVKVLGG